MRCFYLPGHEYKVAGRIELPRDLQRHILTVLRLKAGAPLQLFDGCGQFADALLADDGALIVESVAELPAPRCRLSLIQALPKGDKLDLVLQKGTELGVNDFVVVATERSVGKLSTAKRDKKIERWNKIVQEAARQCHQYHLPQCHVSDSFAAALERCNAQLKLILWEESGVALNAILPVTAPGSVAVIVGPEGGLSEDEVAAARQAGFLEVGLGRRILRTETAGLAIMTILQYLYGDLT